MCNVSPLYIPLTCNVCPLYIPITFIICMFTVLVHIKPVYSTGVHKPSLQYRCTQNQFTVQVYTKPVYSTGVFKTSLQYMYTQNRIKENTFILFILRLSHIEKLPAQKYSFNLIYKHLTWAASENSSKCLLIFFIFFMIWEDDFFKKTAGMGPGNRFFSIS